MDAAPCYHGHHHHRRLWSSRCRIVIRNGAGKGHDPAGTAICVLSRVLKPYGGVRLWPTVAGCMWGIRTEVVVGEMFWLVTALSPMVCKSIAKASKVRILHLPPRAERALDLRKRRSGALFM